MDAQEDDAEEDTWHANGLDDEEGAEDEPDQDRLNSHSNAGPHDRAPGTAIAPRSLLRGAEIKAFAWVAGTHKSSSGAFNSQCTRPT